MNTINALKQARALLTKGWTKGWFARDADGKTTQSNNENACSWCAAGALRRVTSYDIDSADVDEDNPSHAYWVARRALDAALKDAQFQFRLYNEALFDFNDSQENVEPVLELFDKAIAKLEATSS